MAGCLGCKRVFLMARGLCRLCYGKAKYLVDHGKTTWTRLEKQGKAAPTGKPPKSHAWRRALRCRG